MKRISTAPDIVTSQRMSVPFPKVQKGKDRWEGGREEEGGRGGEEEMAGREEKEGEERGKEEREEEERKREKRRKERTGRRKGSHGTACLVRDCGQVPGYGKFGKH